MKQVKKNLHNCEPRKCYSNHRSLDAHMATTTTSPRPKRNPFFCYHNRNPHSTSEKKRTPWRLEELTMEHAKNIVMPACLTWKLRCSRISKHPGSPMGAH